MSKLIKSLALPLAFALTSCGAEDGAAPTPSTQVGATQVGASQGEAKEASLIPKVSLGASPSSEDVDDVPMTIASLVPEGSTIWIRVESGEAMIELVDEFLTALGAGTDLVSLVGITPFADAMAKVDLEREMGWALSFDESGKMSRTLILPALDRGAVIQGLRSMPDAPQCFGIDDYVVATTLDEYRPGLGSAELTTGLPDGQIAMRINLAEVMKQKAQEIQMGLGQLSSLSAGGFSAAGESFSDMATAAVESAESLDLAINLEDGEVDFSFKFAAAPDSRLDGFLPSGSGDLTELARCLEEDDTMSMMVTVDSSTVQEHLMPLWSGALDRAVAEGELDGMVQALMLEWGALWPLLGDSVVASVETGDGVPATYVFQPASHEAFLKGFDAVVRSLPRNLPDLQVAGPEERASETIYRIEYTGDDAGASALGPFASEGPMSLRIASMQNLSVVTVGTHERAMEAALARIMRASEGLPSSLEYVMDRVGGANPAFVARVDMAAFVRDLAASVEGAPQLQVDPEQGPVHVTYYGGVNGRFWHFGFRADVSGLSDLFSD